MTTEGNGDGETSLGAADIKRVLDALDASSWDEALITVGDVTIAVARNGGALPTGTGSAPAAPAVAPPAPVAVPVAAPVVPVAAAAAPAPVSSQGPVEVVTAPTVGVFWRSPEPGAPPYAEVGQRVEAGATLCIIEVMKLMSHVSATTSGTVVEIHAENAASVEHGAPLFTIALDGS